MRQYSGQKKSFLFRKKHFIILFIILFLLALLRNFVVKKDDMKKQQRPEKWAIKYCEKISLSSKRSNDTRARADFALKNWQNMELDPIPCLIDAGFVYWGDKQKPKMILQVSDEDADLAGFEIQKMDRLSKEKSIVFKQEIHNTSFPYAQDLLFPANFMIDSDKHELYVRVYDSKSHMSEWLLIKELAQ